MKKEPYHFVALTLEEKKLVAKAYLKGLPHIIKSLELEQDLFDEFQKNYLRIKTEDRKNVRIGITGAREDKLKFYEDVEEAVKQIQACYKERTETEIPKQAVFWMAGKKLILTTNLRN